MKGSNMKYSHISNKLVLALLIIISACGKDLELPGAVSKTGVAPSLGTGSVPTDLSFHEDGEVEVVFENDTTNGINVIFLGDGYTKKELGKIYGTYKKDASGVIKALFDSPPFSEYKNHFNAYIVYAESKEIGPSIENETLKKTRFGATLFAGGPSGLTLLRVTNYNAVSEYTLKLKKGLSFRNLILMSVNNSDRGSAGLNSNLPVAGNKNYLTMVHEVGHAFAGLGDEYFFTGYNENLIDVNYLPNLDTTSNLNIVKWHHFINLKNYEQVKAYEGGNYKEFGIWRPDSNSIMKNGLFFNAPSREAIVRRIMAIKGLEFNFETFLEIDRRSIDKIINLDGRRAIGNNLDNNNSPSETSLVENRNACTIN